MGKGEGAGLTNHETLRSEWPTPTGPVTHVLVVLGSAGVRLVPLGSSGSLDIGRGEGVDVRIADPRMSRRHVRLHVGETFALEDLSSANGVRIQGVPLAKGATQVLAPEVPVELGQTMLVIRRHEQRADIDAQPLAPPVLDRPMRALLEVADRAAPSSIAVLLLGETGVGKDVVAERIHRTSQRSAARLLRLNCAALAPSLLEAELFGYEKGAFTGATKAKIGLLEAAAGGTVFLDEIGDLSLDLQAKLLMVLERKEVLPVGALRTRAIDVRVIAATNRSLGEEIARGNFRADLFYRLNGVTLEIPPLRDRLSEIEGLARYFAREAARSLGRPEPSLSPEALTALHAHSWPGNVRELRNVIERAVLLQSADAEPVIEESDVAFPTPVSASSVSTAQARDEARDAVVKALAETGGNQTRAAALLGISRNTLIARIEKFGLVRPLARPRRC